MSEHDMPRARWGWRILLIFPGLPVVIALVLWLVIHQWAGHGPRSVAAAPVAASSNALAPSEPPKQAKQPHAPPAAPAPIAPTPPPPAPESGEVKVAAGAIKNVTVADSSVNGRKTLM